MAEDMHLYELIDVPKDDSKQDVSETNPTYVNTRYSEAWKQEKSNVSQYQVPQLSKPVLMSTAENSQMDAKLVNYDFKHNMTKRCLVVISLFAALLSILTVVAISPGVAGFVHQHSVMSEIKELNAKLSGLVSDTLKNISQLMSHIDNLNISDLPDKITTLKKDIIFHPYYLTTLGDTYDCVVFFQSEEGN